MRVTEIISGQKRPFPSLEIVPPLKGVTKCELLDSIRPFIEFNPPYINVTSHRDEVEFRQEADGTFTRHLLRRRVSETAVCASIQSEFKLEVVPHVICAGTTAERTESLFEDFKFMGISNLLALRGDSLVGEKRFEPEKGGYRYASELVTAARAFSAASGADFCIGVGGYPEKHFEAPNLEMDIENLKKKVDAGADYIVTQMFFDNADYFSYVGKCREAGIDVPIIPGIKPLSTARQVALLPESFSIDIPKELAGEMNSHAGDKQACYQIGVEWAVAQCRGLLEGGVPAVHFYTMGRPDNVISILRECF